MSSKLSDDLAALLEPAVGPSKDVQARQMLIYLGRKVLEAVNKTEIGFLGVKYDLLNKLGEEVNKLPNGQAEKILSEVKQLLSQWP